MERQATQPAAVPSGRKRRPVSSKKPKLEEEAQAPAPDMKATRELEMALIGLPRAEDPLPPPTPSPVCSVNELMEGTLKDYEEECMEEGTSPLVTKGGEEQDLAQMETQLNHLLYEMCPFHPHQFIYCVNPQTQFGHLRFKCPQERCPIYLFEDTREVMMEKLKEDTHPQVRARLQRGELKCQCGFVPKMKLSRTNKNYQKVFSVVGAFSPMQHPVATFNGSMAPCGVPENKRNPP